MLVAYFAAALTAMFLAGYLVRELRDHVSDLPPPERRTPEPQRVLLHGRAGPPAAPFDWKQEGGL